MKYLKAFNIVSALLVLGHKISAVATANDKLQDISYASHVPLAISRLDAAKFYVNGSMIPDIPFDLGPTYAGLLPVSESDPDRKLYFWYFPAKNESDTLTVWLNGGPGCSSLEGAIQENGPIVWRKGTFKPVKNEYSWTNFTNMLYIEQPIGTGFSQGLSMAKNELDIAHEFIGFMTQFFGTFEGTKTMRLFLSGESYAGKYIPYIADVMLALDGPQSFNFQGSLLIDPKITSDAVSQKLPAAALMARSKQNLGLSDDTTTELMALAESCGFPQYLEMYLVYPAVKSGMPALAELADDCDLIWEKLANAAFRINPNFNIYKITDSGLQDDVLGFPNSSPITPIGNTVYFAREDVQKAINAPKVNWTTCTEQKVFPIGDRSPDVVHEVLPRVIQKSKRTIIAHGMLDFVLIEEGTRLALQNMTWHGRRGFDNPPEKSFTTALQGETGNWQEERGLTLVSLKLSGHMIPVDQPASAFKLGQYLVGAIGSLSHEQTFH